MEHMSSLGRKNNKTPPTNDTQSATLSRIIKEIRDNYTFDTGQNPLARTLFNTKRRHMIAHDANLNNNNK